MTLLSIANNKTIFRKITCLELLNNFDLEDMESSHSESSKGDIDEKYSCLKKRSIAGGKQKSSKKQKRYDSESVVIFSLYLLFFITFSFFRSLQIIVCRMWK